MITTALFLDGVLEVVNVLSISVPAYTRVTGTFSFLLGVDEWLESHVERRIRFQQINNINLLPTHKKVNAVATLIIPLL